MKTAIAQLALLACLATASTATAAVHVPDTSLTSTVPGIVDLDAPATVHIEVAGRSADYAAAPGRLNVAVPGVPDGLHEWRITVTHGDETTQEHAGFVQVLNVAGVVQAHVHAAVQAAGEARDVAQGAADAAHAATTAAAEARLAAQAVHVPEDLARRGDLAGLATMVQVLHANATQQASARHEEQVARVEAVEHRVRALDGSVENLVFVAVLGLVVLAVGVLHARRNAATSEDRALLRAVALRLRITPEAPEYQQALQELDLEARKRPLLDSLNPAQARRPRRAPQEVEEANP